MLENEIAARQEAIFVYGKGTHIVVSRDENGGRLRVLNIRGQHITGWYWDKTSTSQKTEAQAWYSLLGMIRDDAKGR